MAMENGLSEGSGQEQGLEKFKKVYNAWSMVGSVRLLRDIV